MIAEGSVLNGRYRLDRLIGKGGFARVYLSTDLLLERRVAIKVLIPELLERDGDTDLLAWFVGEARRVAALRHPNILDVYDYGQVEDTAFLVMPYVQGGTLQDRLRGGRGLDLAAAGSYLRQAAAALDYAHQRNLIHRDIKPQNMLLDEQSGQLLLADFGIARVLSSAAGTQTYTAAIGTPAYMAPEQFQGRVGRATDLYALGCVLFQLLTGAPPFGGETVQMMYGHVFQPIPSVAERSGGRVPASLQPVIARALAKAPEDRFGSAVELAEAFQAAVAASETAGELPRGGPANGSLHDRTAPQAVTLPPSADDGPVVVSRADSAPLPAPPPRWFSGRLPLLGGVGAVLIILLAIVIARVATADANTRAQTIGQDPTASTVPVSNSLLPTATIGLAGAITPSLAPAPSPTATLPPPTATPLAPTATPVPPTATPIPPTLTPTPFPTAFVPPTATPLPLAPDGGYAANFRTWVLGDSAGEASRSIDPATGEYRVGLLCPACGSITAAPEHRAYASFILEVYARAVAPITEPGAYAYGLIFLVHRTSEPTLNIADYYSFVVSTSGNFNLNIVNADGTLTQVQPTGPSAAINTGSALNRLTVICRDGTITLAINGQPVGTYSDPDITAGEVGVTLSSIRGNTNPGGVAVAFSNLRLVPLK